MTREEINTIKYKVCCPMCDNKKCVRDTDSCEAEQWAKSKVKSEGQGMTFEEKAEIVISQLRADRDRLQNIIEQIRAEIEQGYCVANNDYDHGRNYGLYMATQIIDKYKTESENKECI